MSSNRTIANNTWTDIIYNEETVDTLGEYNTSTGIFTAKDAGVYIVIAKVHWINRNANVSYYISLSKNNNYTPGNMKRFADQINANNGNSSQSVTAIFDLVAGDTMRVKVYQNSGGNETIDAEAYTIDNWFDIAKVA
jgi:hypothetical protein